MKRLSHPLVPLILAGILTLVFGAVCAAFVRQPTLASFADDSVSYLVMAQVFSPFQAASPAVAAAFAREAFYPPLFPLILALAGAASDIAWAHVLTALLLAACLPLAYALGARWMGSRWAAVLAILCVALLPALWINAKGILSEPLFCLLLLAAFFVLDSKPEGKAKTVQLALLMAAMALTRTAALPVIAVYALWAMTRRAEGRMRAAIPALAAFAAYSLWVLLRPTETADDNFRILLGNIGGALGADQPWALAGASLMRQANAVAEAWVGGLLLYWVEGRPLRIALAGLAGGLAIAGLALRLRAGKADGWMMAGYLALYLAWPFYDQMGRFLFPVLPVLVLYAFLAAAAAIRALGRPEILAHGLVSLLLLSLTLPAMAFLQQRAGTKGPHATITDWYRTPDLAQARARAEIHLGLLADMAVIREVSAPGQRVMWVAPSYVALLADRHGVRAPAAGLAPAAYLKAVREAKVDYVFLSAYHPRDTLDDGAWRAGTRALDGYGRIVHARAGAGGTLVRSLLIKAEQ